MIEIRESGPVWVTEAGEFPMEADTVRVVEDHGDHLIAVMLDDKTGAEGERVRVRVDRELRRPDHKYVKHPDYAVGDVFLVRPLYGHAATFVEISPRGWKRIDGVTA